MNILWLCTVAVIFSTPGLAESFNGRSMSSFNQTGNFEETAGQWYQIALYKKEHIKQPVCDTLFVGERTIIQSKNYCQRPDKELIYSIDEDGSITHVGDEIIDFKIVETNPHNVLAFYLRNKNGTTEELSIYARHEAQTDLREFPQNLANLILAICKPPTTKDCHNAINESTHFKHELNPNEHKKIRTKRLLREVKSDKAVNPSSSDNVQLDTEYNDGDFTIQRINDTDFIVYDDVYIPMEKQPQNKESSKKEEDTIDDSKSPSSTTNANAIRGNEPENLKEVFKSDKNISINSSHAPKELSDDPNNIISTSENGPHSVNIGNSTRVNEETGSSYKNSTPENLLYDDKQKFLSSIKNDTITKKEEPNNQSENSTSIILEPGTNEENKNKYAEDINETNYNITNEIKNNTSWNNSEDVEYHKSDNNKTNTNVTNQIQYDTTQNIKYHNNSNNGTKNPNATLSSTLLNNRVTIKVSHRTTDDDPKRTDSIPFSTDQINHDDTNSSDIRSSTKSFDYPSSLNFTVENSNSTSENYKYNFDNNDTTRSFTPQYYYNYSHTDMFDGSNITDDYFFGLTNTSMNVPEYSINTNTTNNFTNLNVGNSTNYYNSTGNETNHYTNDDFNTDIFGNYTSTYYPNTTIHPPRSTTKKGTNSASMPVLNLILIVLSIILNVRI